MKNDVETMLKKLQNYAIIQTDKNKGEKIQMQTDHENCTKYQISLTKHVLHKVSNFIYKSQI